MQDKWTRREILRLGFAGATGLALSRLALASPSQRRSDGKVKNIIFMVSDGMSAGVPSLTDEFGKLVRGKGSFWYQLLQSPEATLGFFDMASLNSLVTDSSSASSSWGSGSRIFNGAVNVLPDGTRLTPIAHIVKNAGKKVGLVTTTRITHATPAGFAAVQPNRDDEDDIAPQYKGIVDVLMGGGLRHYAPDQRKDKRNLIEEYQQAGYTYWNRREQVLSSERPEKVLGLFYGSHLPFTIDHIHSDTLKQSVPTLAEMTRKALEILSQSREGFLLQVEGGRVDHAAHANDAAAIFWDQLAFDDAIEVVYEFASKRDDTLVIITSDHGNSNPGLNGMGVEYGDSNKAFARLTQARCSFELLPSHLRGADTDKVRAVIREQIGLEINGEEASALANALANRMPPIWNAQHRNLQGLLGEILSNYNGIGWTGTSHTADYVWVTALGTGREEFHGLVRNTDAFYKMLKLFGLSFKNPSMSPEEARKYLSRAPRVETPHWV
ncbi:MAG: alkaline phosphatase [Fimbriimonadales bacterium]|nr:alkaline phosphatase [Fimbriimonadales bacterium]